MIQGSQYSVEEDGSLVIESVLMGRDDGIYTCIADTPNVGQDEAISTVIITSEYCIVLIKYSLMFPYVCSSSKNQHF